MSTKVEKVPYGTYRWQLNRASDGSTIQSWTNKRSAEAAGRIWDTGVMSEADATTIVDDAAAFLRRGGFRTTPRGTAVGSLAVFLQKREIVPSYAWWPEFAARV